MFPQPVTALADRLDAMPDGVVLATADAVLDEWRKHLPEVERPRLARVLLVTYASGSWAARKEVEAKL